MSEFSDRESSRIDGLGRREFLACLGAGAAAWLTPRAFGESAGDAARPNIIVILADDLGYGDLGVTGCKDVPTPHIDAIATGGVRFTHGYVSCPVCSPTRAGLMTGRYQQRFGHWYNPGPPVDEQPNIGLPLSETTIADRLKEAGYATGLVGKWHLGLGPEFHPMKRGFDEFFGFPHGSHSYVDSRADTKNPIMRGTEAVDEPAYLTEAFTREAVDFIRRRAGAPFFLYLSYNAVHGPLQAPDAYLERFKAIEDETRRTYAAMLSALDDGVGAVLAALREKGIEEDTLVFFLSDNGGPIAVNGSRNTPFSGAKGTLQEGGIRVPFFLRWPERLPAGRTCDLPVISLDILPTCLAAAGGALPSDAPLDGVNLLPYLAGNEGAPHDYLFWRYHDGAAVRHAQ
ncbi:MAG TPA: sulfatase-like hydrolase/transferase, partial [Candidatus Hydrogenedentes bacterium]|nr:sulfatase-like hydrolase/transferase [Candidatus Hydrogenedentota bacterium]